MHDLVPMSGVLFVVLLLVLYIPGLTLWLPGLFDYVDSSYRSGD